MANTNKLAKFLDTIGFWIVWICFCPFVYTFIAGNYIVDMVRERLRKKATHRHKADVNEGGRALCGECGKDLGEW